ncbi:hypothetical protein [Streptomyces sp. NPDC051921]|uniref:hypothetical protein n=1 Tax=Streptomyces sp. NPDC051921 TaxID=3155806 RepID=UPI00342E3E77
MLTFDNVRHAPLSRMKAAADSWSEMRRKLHALAEDARRTMAAKVKAGDWRGVNAEVTKPFIDKTAKEFEDAAKAAEGIHKVLQDGYRTFRKAQDDLTRIVETEAPHQGLVVRSNGVVEAAYSLRKDAVSRPDPETPASDLKERQAIAALQRRIDAVIENCDDADVACANALRANITGDKHNFSAPKYAGLDEEEARRALDLAGKGRDISHEELVRLNELLADNKGSKTFSRAFYDGLGARGALEFFGQLSTDTYDYPAVDEQRLADVQALQRNLGLNLATATQGGDAWTEHWSTEMRRLGTERIPLTKYDSSPAFGYQLLGGIMRYGDYDPKFLVPIAEHVTQLHAKDPYLFANSGSGGGWLPNQYNPSGVNGSGFDPMIPMLEALGHSPEAAKDFFSGKPTSYEMDGSVGGTLDLGKNKDGEGVDNYLDFFANEKYEFFADIDGHDPDDAKKAADYMPDALGHALEAATLGHAWDDPRPELRRDATSAEIMADVVTKYGSDAELLKKYQSSIADSLGNMGAGYIDDLNWGLTDNEPDSAYAAKGKDMLVHPQFGREATVEFLSTLGQHPDAYATVSTAGRVYTASMLEAQVGADGRIDEAPAREAARTGASLQGLLDESRAGQVAAEGMKLHEDYEKAQEKKAAWVEFGTTAAIAAGVAFLPATAAAAGAAAVLVPLAVDTGSGALETMAGQVIGDRSEKAVDDHKESMEGKIHDDRRAIYLAGRDGAESPMKQFVKVHRAHVSGDFKQDLIADVDSGYSKGNSFAGQTGNAPETG